MVGYAYSVDGRLASVTAGSATTTYSYDPAGQLTGTALPNGVNESRTYDAAGRVTTIAAAGPSGDPQRAWPTPTTRPATSTRSPARRQCGDHARASTATRRRPGQRR